MSVIKELMPAVIFMKSVMYGCVVSLFFCIFNIIKKAKIHISAVYLYLSNPFFCFPMPGNSSNAAFIVRAPRNIFHVFRTRNISEVFYFVIKSVSINVINIARRHRSIMPEPYKSMDDVFFTINRRLHISSIAEYISNSIADLCSIACYIFPYEIACRWIIIKKMPNSFVGYHFASPNIGSREDYKSCRPL